MKIVMLAFAMSVCVACYILVGCDAGKTHGTVKPTTDPHIGRHFFIEGKEWVQVDKSTFLTENKEAIVMVYIKPELPQYSDDPWPSQGDPAVYDNWIDRNGDVVKHGPTPLPVEPPRNNTIPFNYRPRPHAPVKFREATPLPTPGSPLSMGPANTYHFDLTDGLYLVRNGTATKVEGPDVTITSAKPISSSLLKNE